MHVFDPVLQILKARIYVGEKIEGSQIKSPQQNPPGKKKISFVFL